MSAKWPQFSTKTEIGPYLQETKLSKVHGNSHDISNLNRTRRHGRSMEVYKQKTGHGRNGVRWKDMKVTMTLSPSHIVNECIWDKERNRSNFGTSSPIVSYKTIYIHSWSAFHSSFLCDGEQGTAQTCSNGCRSAWDLDYLDLRYWEEVDITYRTNTMSSTAHNNESHMHLNPAFGVYNLFFSCFSYGQVQSIAKFSAKTAAGIGFGTLVSVIYRDSTKLLMSHDIADATCTGTQKFVSFRNIPVGEIIFKNSTNCMCIRILFHESCSLILVNAAVSINRTFKIAIFCTPASWSKIRKTEVHTSPLPSSLSSFAFLHTGPPPERHGIFQGPKVDGELIDVWRPFRRLLMSLPISRHVTDRTAESSDINICIHLFNFFFLGGFLVFLLWLL